MFDFFPGTSRKRAKGGTQKILLAPTLAPVTQKCSQGSSAPLHGFTEVGSSSLSFLSFSQILIHVLFLLDRHRTFVIIVIQQDQDVRIKSISFLEAAVFFEG